MYSDGVLLCCAEEIKGIRAGCCWAFMTILRGIYYRLEAVRTCVRDIFIYNSRVRFLGYTVEF